MNYPGLLFMQGATTPHDKIMDSIRLFAEGVQAATQAFLDSEVLLS
jgi:hypothetical protein